MLVLSLIVGILKLNIHAIEQHVLFIILYFKNIITIAIVPQCYYENKLRNKTNKIVLLTV